MTEEHPPAPDKAAPDAAAPDRAAPDAAALDEAAPDAAALDKAAPDAAAPDAAAPDAAALGAAAVSDTTATDDRTDPDAPSEATARRRARQREAARARSRATMRRLRRRELVGRAALHGSIAAGLVAVAVVVGLVVSTGAAVAGMTPRDLVGDGVRSTAEGVVRTAARPVDAEPVTVPNEGSSTTADIRVYLDHQCPGCRAFDEDQRDYLRDLVASGAATVELHPLAILDRFSQGTRYSTRSAAAVACVADLSPDAYPAATSALFDAQPEEGTPGLTDDEIVDVLTGVEGLQQATEVDACVHDQRFAPWVRAATERALAGPLPDVDADRIESTPTVFVNGRRWDPSAAGFREFVTSVLGDEHAAATSAPEAPEAPEAD